MTIEQTRSGSSEPRPGEGGEAPGSPEADPRTVLAGERTRFAMFRTALALDRTSLAWIRTTLTFATFGFGMIGFFRAVAQATQTEQAARMHQAAIRFGVALLAIGLVSTVLAAISHWRALRRLRRGDTLPVAQWPMAITLAFFLSVAGLYLLWSVLSA